MASEEIDVVVIGAGQAGLATSHELSARGVAHVVLERSDHVGGSWADRWDSFCLVTPNHTIRLPGGEYSGDDPHGFLPRDQIVAHLQRYGAGAPVRTGVAVEALEPLEDGSLALRTADNDIRARHAVVAAGAFPQAHRPAWMADLPPGLPLFDATDYRNPAALPDGAVLVVGSGQTGCQIAEELLLAGRRVILACGRAPWIHRSIDGRDTVDWLLDTPFFEQRADALPAEARLWANPQATGARGGHDLHTRTLAALGVQLAGHAVAVEDRSIQFADDLADSAAWGDARYAQICDLIRAVCGKRGIPEPHLPEPEPFDSTAAVHSLDVRDVGAVMLTAGYRPNYRTWINVPEAFDETGFPLQVDGTSTGVPGLHFVGVHFLRTRKSALLFGVGEDAGVVAQAVAG